MHAQQHQFRHRLDLSKTTAIELNCGSVVQVMLSKRNPAKAAGLVGSEIEQCNKVDSWNSMHTGSGSQRMNRLVV